MIVTVGWLMLTMINESIIVVNDACRELSRLTEGGRAWLIGVARARLMGFGMSKTMHGSVSTEEMVIGLACGCIGLLICVLDYPVYLYVSKKQ